MGQFRPSKAGSQHYKSGMPRRWDKSCHMQWQDKIHEEFIKLSESRKLGQNFIPANQDHVITSLIC